MAEHAFTSLQSRAACDPSLPLGQDEPASATSRRAPFALLIAIVIGALAAADILTLFPL